MGWFVYILECKNGSFYTGITWNLKRRIFEHNNGIKTCLQKSKIPVKLVYWEKFENRFNAAKREKEIKGWSRLKKRKLIEQLALRSITTKRAASSMVEQPALNR